GPGTKAVIYRAYGSRDVMFLDEIADPGPPGAGEVRVRVQATSVNPVDGKVRRGELKLVAGRGFPKRPGLDFSGIVEAVGSGVTGFKPGDAVFGAARSMSEGAFAERILVRATAIAQKPATLDHAVAAGVPTVAVAALQALRDIVTAQPGDAILVNGCTGGVGLFALQIGRSMGARMTGVCGTDGVATARAFGADRVVDYRRGDPVGAEGSFRAILELSGRLPFAEAERLLGDGGRYVDFSPSPAALIGNSIANPFRHHKHVFAMTAAQTADLERLAADLDSGVIQAAPTRSFPLARFAEAFEAAESGGVIGKVVVRIAED
ncbi:MAG: NAD(P)-dependent alcohol dehydrogenase, partial [Methylobacteriaceae bacterium]|nr:NAD(P)-dependent alcohol dehydrogenase [Methylobacteriaceae bacterium]